jgi:hypothetical protein
VDLPPTRWSQNDRAALEGFKDISNTHNDSTRLDFNLYLKEVFDLYLTPLMQEEVDVDGWVSGNNHGAAYATRLLSTVTPVLKHKDMQANAFVKDESYPVDGVVNPTIKHIRTINAYTDPTKAMYGPFFRKIEKAFFTSKLSRFFVKMIPVAERPGHLQRLFGCRQVTLADFSSFESHMRREFADGICHGILRIGGDFLPPAIQRCVREHMLGTNLSVFKSTGVRVQVDQTLMSGAVWTSLGNCMLSFGLVTYLRLRAKYPLMSAKELAGHVFEVDAVFEGDDSLSAGGAYDDQLVTQLGLILKSKVLEDFGKGDFCGISKPLNRDVLFTDAVKVVCNLFVLPKAYMNSRSTKQAGLLRAKALSLYWLYNRCPIVSHLCFAVLRRTRSIRPDGRTLTYHQNECLAQSSGKYYLVPPATLDDVTRQQYADAYGISPPEQIALEEALRRWGEGDGSLIKLPAAFDPYVAWGYSHVAADPNLPYPPLARDRVHDMSQLIGAGPVYLRPFLREGRLVSAKIAVKRPLKNAAFDMLPFQKYLSRAE